MPEPRVTSKGTKYYLRRVHWKGKLVRIFETKQFKPDPAPVSATILKYCNKKEIEIKGRPVTILTPKQNASNKVVFFSHGGGHLNNITKYHWQMIYYLIKRTNATFIVPDYPLLPESNYKGTYEMVEEAFYKTVSDVSNKELIFMGDSAGGAISMVLAQILRNENASIQPSQLILISP